jgi:hypothetical protein
LYFDNPSFSTEGMIRAQAELQAKTWPQILLATDAQVLGVGYETRYTVDGWSLPDTIWNIFSKARSMMFRS